MKLIDEVRIKPLRPMIKTRLMEYYYKAEPRSWMIMFKRGLFTASNRLHDHCAFEFIDVFK